MNCNSYKTLVFEIAYHEVSIMGLMWFYVPMELQTEKNNM